LFSFEEHVWAWAEPKLRELETARDTFPTFQKNCLKAVRAYPAAPKLVGSMARKCQTVLDRAGGALND